MVHLARCSELSVNTFMAWQSKVSAPVNGFPLVRFAALSFIFHPMAALTSKELILNAVIIKLKLMNMGLENKQQYEANRI